MTPNRFAAPLAADRAPGPVALDPGRSARFAAPSRDAGLAGGPMPGARPEPGAVR